MEIIKPALLSDVTADDSILDSEYLPVAEDISRCVAAQPLTYQVDRREGKVKKLTPYPRHTSVPDREYVLKSLREWRNRLKTPRKT